MPDVEFQALAHAAPDFLGNASIISMNECDDCNDYFGRDCEDHLSKATFSELLLISEPHSVCRRLKPITW